MSIRRRLLLALIGALAVTGLAASGVTWYAVRREADRLFDYHLQQMALSLRDQAPQLAGGFFPEPKHDFIVQVWDPGGSRVYLSSGGVPLPEAPAGYETLQVDGHDWRVFTLQQPERTIQVAAPMSLRRDRSTAMALRVLVPVLAIIPFYALFIWLIVGDGLGPLERIAAALRRREPSTLEPLPEKGLPEEVAPLVKELNALLGRLGEALERQKRFTADAAHELRSPLTALAMQLDLAARAASPADSRAALDGLRAGVKRATRLVEQLLTVARLEPEAARMQFHTVDLAGLAASVIAELEPLAEAKRVELRLGRMEESLVHGDEAALRTLVRNLVDNAVRYTPAGGRVSIRVDAEGGPACLSVEDTGPGIPAEERERVFDRFYRVLGSGGEGSGLGLAIVREVAQAHGATVRLDDGEGGKGLRATVCFAVPVRDLHRVVD